MPIKRCKNQSDISLRNFFEGVEKEESTAKAGAEMLKILSWLNQTFPNTEIYGLTAATQLCLLSEDNWFSTNHVKIFIDPIRYYIEYALPKEDAPWRDAFVKGKCNNLEDAKKYILIAMKNSKGWENAAALNEL